MYHSILETDRSIPEHDRLLVESAIEAFTHNTRLFGGGRDGSRISYEWMVGAFGLSVHPILMLRLFEDSYEREDIQSQPVSDMLAEIAHEYPREFGYLKMFFRALDRQQSVAVYDLPASVTRAQARALHESHCFVPKGEPLPESADLAYYCYGHLDFKHPLVDEHPDFAYSQGPINVDLDLSTMELVCRFDTASVSSGGVRSSSGSSSSSQRGGKATGARSRPSRAAQAPRASSARRRRRQDSQRAQG